LPELECTGEEHVAELPVALAEPSKENTVAIHVRVSKTNYGGWPNCYRLANGQVDLIVTTDVGPRIIRFGFDGEENEFVEYDETLGLTGGQEWRNYGGHRLWHAPEDPQRTYYPDNEPVHLQEQAGFVRLIQPVEATTGIEKEMDIRLAPTATHVHVIHRLRNHNRWAVELAPWALSVMAPGGMAIVPLPPRGTHPEFLLPASTLTLWRYTDMSDPRWTWGREYVLLLQDPGAITPQKAGFMAQDGWLAYSRGSHLFVVCFERVDGAQYADLGCSAETWTDADMLELETLGPLTSLEPGACVEHTEEWFLFRDVPMPRSEADVNDHVLPRVKAAKRMRS
jgi:hypothetical protein